MFQMHPLLLPVQNRYQKGDESDDSLRQAHHQYFTRPRFPLNSPGHPLDPIEPPICCVAGFCNTAISLVRVIAASIRTTAPISHVSNMFHSPL